MQGPNISIYVLYGSMEEYVSNGNARTELPLGAHVSGTAPASSKAEIDFSASGELIPAHARSMAFKTCQPRSLSINHSLKTI